MKKLLCAIGLLAVSTIANAQTCEQSFEAIGDPRNGMLYTATVKKPGLSVSSALGQLQKYATDEGYSIGGESIVGDVGEVSFTRTKDLRTPIIYQAQATQSGEVSFSAKLARGQQANADDVRSTFCRVLNGLKTNREGESIAAAARAKSGSGQIIDAKATELSAQLQREIRKTMAGVNSKGKLGNLLVGSSNYATGGEINQAFAPIRAKYLGQKYRIDGQIYTVSKGHYSDRMDIGYLVTQSHGLLGIRASSTYNSNYFTINCTLPPDQAKFFATLSEGDFVKLEGAVADITTEGMQLRDCRQAK